jgi:hypothetical protein
VDDKNINPEKMEKSRNIEYRSKQKSISARYRQSTGKNTDQKNTRKALKASSQCVSQKGQRKFSCPLAPNQRSITATTTIVEEKLRWRRPAMRSI